MSPQSDLVSPQQVQIAHRVVLSWLVGPQRAFPLGFEEAGSPEQLRSDSFRLEKCRGSEPLSLSSFGSVSLPGPQLLTGL